MAFNDFFVGEIATELLKQLISISRKSCLCKSSADSLITSIGELLPIIEEIKYSGVELRAARQFQLDRFSETLRGGLELARKVLASNRWNVYRNLQLARKMEKLEKNVARFVSGPMQAHILADVHHMRFETMERFDRLEGRLEQRLNSMKIGVGTGGWVEEAVKRMEIDEEASSDILGGVGLDLGKSKVKKMLIGRDDLNVVGIWGIGGSGKTTLAHEVCKDNQVRSYFNNKILFLTVSQSPDVEQLRARIWGFITGNEAMGYSTSNFLAPRGKLPSLWGSGPRTLYLANGFQIFGKQIVNECKGLPLALKVIGASLRDQPEMYWASARKRLLRGEPICEAHENKLIERMAISVEYLNKKVKECFLDLGSFPEDKKIPLDILINMWVALHDIDEEEAFAILVELSDKNLLTLVKDARTGDAFGSYYEIYVTQHDVLRDLALHLSNRGDVNERKRLLMPKRETELPREWERNSDLPFNAQIVSVHTGEMREMDWFRMEFPKTEVLILNFSSEEYFLPPFIDDMPKLRALIIINYGTSDAKLENFQVFTNLAKLGSLWLEKVSVPQLSNVHLRNLQKLSMVFCKLNNSFDQSVVELPQIFPRLSELTIDHCDDLIKLPLSICKLNSLQSLSITECHRLCELPTDLGMLKKLQILRLYACPELKVLPPSIGELVGLKYLDISQCVNLSCLPKEIGRLASLEKIDMRECLQILDLPTSLSNLKSLRRVICDDEVSGHWKNVEKAMPNLHVQVADRWYSLDWLNA
ncbi:Disease resistance protein [Corchorus capsularis]|uniref:Disease resistance protein n=1 Tax=Corchorus capsularis TaxID=210143 RepID=A0A1R3IYP1_COCAP|nr:Disease resistance protein [Corchorus capsularis]